MRERDWCNVISAHEGDPTAYVWRLQVRGWGSSKPVWERVRYSTTCRFIVDPRGVDGYNGKQSDLICPRKPQNFTIGEHRLRPPAPDGTDKRPRREDDVVVLGGSGGGGGVSGVRRDGGVDKAPPDAPVSSVAISSCGNFGVVGTSAGRVDRYNMQSGLHRGTYCRGAVATKGVSKGAQGRRRSRRDGSILGPGYMRVDR